MSGSAAKAERRDIKRVLGATVAADLTSQQQATRNIVATSQAHEDRLDFHEQQLAALSNRIDSQGDQFLLSAVFFGKNFWQRLRWLVRGV